MLRGKKKKNEREKGIMTIDGLIMCSKRGFERHLCSVDNDKQRDLAGL